MMIKKMYLTLFLFLSLLSPLVANDIYLGLSGGHANVGEEFDTTYSLGYHLGLMNRYGIGFEFSGQYISAEGTEAGTPDLDLIPLRVGINYVLNNRQKVSPYFGAHAVYNLVNDAYDDPSLGFGAKAGVLFKMDRQLAVFVEALYQTLDLSYSLDAKETNLSLSPLSVSFGIVMTFNKNPYKLKQKNNKIKPIKRVKKPKRQPKLRRLR